MFNRNYFDIYRSSPLRDFVRYRLRLTPWPRALRACVRNLPGEGRVLDVGCGTGGLLELIEHTRPDLYTLGTDIAEIPQFLSKGGFINASAHTLPFADNTFDLITCAHVLEHLHDPGPVVAELLRVCRPNGYLYLETPSQRSALIPFGHNFWDDPTHVRPYSKRALTRLLALNGVNTITSGTKRSLAAVLLGLPYMIVGRLTGQTDTSTPFLAYTFGMYVYVLGRKPAARLSDT